MGIATSGAGHGDRPLNRNMDYVRSLLLKMEEAPRAVTDPLELLGDDKSENAEYALSYYLRMLTDAGFVRSNKIYGKGRTPNYTEIELTWQGHEFLETVRDPEIWRKTKEGAHSAGNFAMSFLADVAKAYAKLKAKELLGLDI